MKPVKKQKTKCDGCGRDFIERKMIVQIGLQVFCGDCKDKHIGLPKDLSDLDK